MDEDTAALCILALLFLTILSTPLLITACVALSTTRKWAANQRRPLRLPTTKVNGEGTDLEASEGLIGNKIADEESDDDFEEDEFLDAADRRFYAQKQERKLKAQKEREADLRLTFGNKFVKEWKKCWVGSGGSLEERKQEAEFKEEEGRRKVAREAVREVLRLQRRMERRGKAAEGLPRYGEGVKSE